MDTATILHYISLTLPYIIYGAVGAITAPSIFPLGKSEHTHKPAPESDAETPAHGTPASQPGALPGPAVPRQFHWVQSMCRLWRTTWVTCTCPWLSARAQAVRLAYIAVFTVTAHCYTLVCWDIIQVGTTAGRTWAWRVNLSTLTALLVVGLPSLTSWTFASAVAQGTAQRAALATGLLGASIAALASIGSVVPVSMGAAYQGSGVLGRLAVVGIIVSAALSGYGTVNTPTDYFDKQAAVAAPAQGVVDQGRRVAAAAQAQLDALAQVYAETQGRASASSPKDSASRGSSPQPTVGTPPRGMHEAGGGGSAAALPHAASPTLSLHSLDLGRTATLSPSRRPRPAPSPSPAGLTRARREMLRQLAQLVAYERTTLQKLVDQQQLKQDIAGYTWWTKFIYSLARVLAFHGAWRLINAVLNIVLSRPFKRDPISTVLHFALPVLSMDVLSQVVPTASFILTGVLAILSLRSFLVSLSRLSTRISQGTTSLFVTLAGTYVLGTYSISSLVLMRTTLPPQYRAAVSAALGEIEFDVLYHLSYFVFLIATGGTLLMTIGSKVWSASKRSLARSWYAQYVAAPEQQLFTGLNEDSVLAAESALPSPQPMQGPVLYPDSEAPRYRATAAGRGARSVSSAGPTATPIAPGTARRHQSFFQVDSPAPRPHSASRRHRAGSVTPPRSRPGDLWKYKDA